MADNKVLANSDIYMQGKVNRNTGLARAWYDNKVAEHGQTKKGMLYDCEQTPEVDRNRINESSNKFFDTRTSRVGRTGNSLAPPPQGTATLRNHGT